MRHPAKEILSRDAVWFLAFLSSLNFTRIGAISRWIDSCQHVPGACKDKAQENERERKTEEFELPQIHGTTEPLRVHIHKWPEPIRWTKAEPAGSRTCCEQKDGHAPRWFSSSAPAAACEWRFNIMSRYRSIAVRWPAAAATAAVQQRLPYAA